MMIPPVDESAPIPFGARCQEALPQSREEYVPCNALATSIVRHEKDRRSYYMCPACADHNIHNRGGKLISHRPLVFTAESLIEAFGDQAYHKGVRMVLECLQGDEMESCRQLSRANIELMQRGYHKKPEVK